MHRITSPTRYTISSTRYADYSHDSLNRLNKRVFSTTRPLVNNYLYALSDRGTADGVTYRTTQLRTEIIDQDAYRYYYDAVGNVVKVEKGIRTNTNTEDTTTSGYSTYRTYEYDYEDQLSRETYAASGGAVTTTYTYSGYGNMTQRDISHPGSSVTATRVNYLYGTDTDAGWNELLTGVQTRNYTAAGALTNTTTQTIDYDAIGNPVKYLGANLTWEGRELKSYAKNGVTTTYAYDASGLRSYKNNGGTKSTYMYVGDQLVYEKRGTTELYFWYDSYGHLAAFRAYFVDGTNVLYYALTNAQGDVLGLYNGNGDPRVIYEYDSWGNGTIVTDATVSGVSIGTLNPIRYRGYYYDTETGLYYLQSRYYDPQVGRFINADGLLDNRGVLH